MRGGVRRPPVHRGFTLIELLVVITIIILVSVVALPTVLPALNHRQVSEAGRILQGALVGARDKAIHDNQPCGIRLLPDPSFPIAFNSMADGSINPYSILAYDRVVPIDSAPEYSEGYCTPVPPAAITDLLGGTTPTSINASVAMSWTNLSSLTLPPALLLVESPNSPTTGAPPNAPTNWYWNVRVGDRIQLNNTGVWYTIVGPMTVDATGGNTELFVNAGAPDATSNLNVPQITTTVTTAGTTSTFTESAEYLLLVNGRDDNANGWIDEGWDGVDNNGNGTVDDFFIANKVLVSEWETEVWVGGVATAKQANLPYTIRRRPAVSPNAREIALPTQMVIDATSLLLTQKERSRLPINAQTRFSGTIDIVINPDGTVASDTNYGAPSSLRMDNAFYHFWLSERQDLNPLQPGANASSTNVVAAPWSGTSPYTLPIAQPGGSNAGGWPGPYLKGQYSVVSLNARTGQITIGSNLPFFYDSTLGYTNSPGDPNATGATVNYNATYPFIQAEQGISGGP